jgi:DNA polymerase-3 subunit gamma/tau
MLSSGAFNALLKTLEEPPAHVVFILATTELQKLPATITSRCQRFDFKRISTDDIALRLEYIASKENISVTHEAAKLIGRISQGGMRDAISLLELCSGVGRAVDTALVNSTAGIMGREKSAVTVNAILKKDIQALFETVGQIVSSSSDLSLFIGELIEFYRDMLVIKSIKDSAAYLDLTKEEYSTTLELSERFTSERLLYHIRHLENTYNSMNRNGGIKRVTAELALVSLTDDRLHSTPEALLSRVAMLEEKLASGNLLNSVSINTATAPKSEEKIASAPSFETQEPKLTEDIKPLPFWTDVLQNTERSAPWAAAHLKGTKAFWDGTNVVIVLSDSFTINLVNDEKTRSIIASGINLNDDTMAVNHTNIKFRFDKVVSDDDPIESLK